MKKQKCGFRQKLGIVLAAGMIISNVNFAVLSVSATDLADDPNGPAQENTMPIDPEVQEVLNAVNSLPSLEVWQVPDGEGLELGVARLHPPLIVVVELGQADGHLARAGAGGGDHHQGPAGLHIVVTPEALVEIGRASCRERV